MDASDGKETKTMPEVQESVLERPAWRPSYGSPKKATRMNTVCSILDSDATRISYLPRVAAIFDDDIPLAIFLQHIWFWYSFHEKRQSLQDGWLFQTAEQIYEDTRLTYRQQTRVRELLVKSGVLIEKNDYQNHRLLFKV